MSLLISNMQSNVKDSSETRILFNAENENENFPLGNQVFLSLQVGFLWISPFSSAEVSENLRSLGSRTQVWAQVWHRATNSLESWFQSQEEVTHCWNQGHTERKLTDSAFKLKQFVQKTCLHLQNRAQGLAVR